MSESMQWHNFHQEPWAAQCAQLVVDFVNANGGEATYTFHPERFPDARIAVRTRDGWAYCAPGQRVVMGGIVCLGCGAPLADDQVPCDGWGDPVREFTVEDA